MKLFENFTFHCSCHFRLYEVMRWKGKVHQNINLALGSKDGNVECGAATQWEGPVWLWRRVEGKVVQTDFTQFVSALMVGVEGVSA
jgi:hypothetical protein